MLRVSSVYLTISSAAISLMALASVVLSAIARPSVLAPILKLTSIAPARWWSLRPPPFPKLTVLAPKSPKLTVLAPKSPSPKLTLLAPNAVIDCCCGWNGAASVRMLETGVSATNTAGLSGVASMPGVHGITG